MFATLLGPLPRPLHDADASTERLVETAIRAQEAAGLEPVTDGGLAGSLGPLDAWRLAASLTDRAVKAVLIGPYTAARAAGASAADRAAVTLERSARSNATILELAAAGCPLVEIHEPAAVSIGADESERALFRDAHLRLLDGVEGTHPSLALTGGSADAAGIETILAAPYASLAVDLIAGPDNWYLVAATPGECGIVCGALPAEPDTNDGPETLLWAAGYAASMRGRGGARVGLGTASSLAGLDWAAAVAKLDRLGTAAHLATASLEQRLAAFDPRAVSSRAAALGTVEGLGPRRPPEPDEAT